MSEVKWFFCKFCDFSTASAFAAVMHLKDAHCMTKLFVDLSRYYDVSEKGEVHEHNH